MEGLTISRRRSGLSYSFLHFCYILLTSHTLGEHDPVGDHPKRTRREDPLIETDGDAFEGGIGLAEPGHDAPVGFDVTEGATGASEEEEEEGNLEEPEVGTHVTLSVLERLAHAGSASPVELQPHCAEGNPEPKRARLSDLVPSAPPPPLPQTSQERSHPMGHPEAHPAAADASLRLPGPLGPYLGPLLPHGHGGSLPDLASSGLNSLPQSPQDRSLAPGSAPGSASRATTRAEIMALIKARHMLGNDQHLAPPW